MKNMILKDKNELWDYVKTHSVKPLGIGREGSCFLLDNNQVIKVLCQEYDSQYALQFKDIDVDSFIFSKYGILINNYINAIFMEYVKGLNLQDALPINQNILDLGEGLQKLVLDIKKISSLGILVKDFCPSNIIYSENSFKVIDTMCYLYFKNFNFEIDNLREIMNKIYNHLIFEIYNCKQISKNLLYLGNLELLEEPKEYFKNLKSKIEEISDQEVITLNDMKKTLKKISYKN